MFKKFAFVFFAVTLITISTTQPRGGRGGGGGGRSSGRGSVSSRGSFSSTGSKSFSGSHTGQHSFSGSHTGSQHSSGGWFPGFFHSPYHYTYIPIHHSNRNSVNSYNEPKEEKSENKEEKSDQNKDDSNYAVGYAISRSLSSDFFSIFNMVHDISKIPDKIKSKEYLPATTTEGPVSTYNISQIINNPFAKSISIIEFDSESNNLDDAPSFNMANSTHSTDYNENNIKDGSNIFSILFKGSEDIGEV